MSLYLDVTEFLRNPIKTGIQRIVGEICRCLPADSAIPVRLHSGRLLGFSPALTQAIGKHFTDHTKSTIAEICRLGAVEAGSPIEVLQTGTVLVPEAFTEPQRVEFFCSMPERQRKRCRFVVYDLLPFTHPEYFPSAVVQGLHGYFHVVRQAERCGFISEYTRDMYFGRLKRSNVRDGPVLPLGCDSLGPRPKVAVLDRPLKFTVIGTIEPRKKHALILDAFEPLLRQIAGLRLSFVGNLGWVEPEFAQRIHVLANDKASGFQFHSDPDDGAIRTHLEQSRASIYVSAAEGYGLPPVESLWCGSPVIASASIPSLQRLGTAGIHYVEPLNVANLQRAVLSFVDNRYANQKAEEALQLDLPTWQSFADEVLKWCSEEIWASRPIQMPHGVTKSLQQGHNRDRMLEEIRHTGEADPQHPGNAKAELQVYQGYTEADLVLFDRFSAPQPLSATPGFITDFLGVRTRSSFVRGVEHLNGKVLGLPVPDDGWHSEAIEYVGLLKSVASANGRFTSMELGAGWAPWSVAAAAAARLSGLTDVRLCAVEADPGHFDFMLDHFRHNGLNPDAHRLINAAVGVEAGKGRWPKLSDPSADFGSRPQRAAEACQMDHVGRQFTEWLDVDIVPISELLNRELVWDLVHIDVQGWEADLCSAAGILLDERVRWLVVGTHDAKLHGDLISLMFQRGWALENEKPPRFTWTDRAPVLMAMTTHDGTQVWRNPKLSL